MYSYLVRLWPGLMGFPTELLSGERHGQVGQLKPRDPPSWTIALSVVMAMEQDIK